MQNVSSPFPVISSCTSSVFSVGLRTLFDPSNPLSSNTSNFVFSLLRLVSNRMINTITAATSAKQKITIKTAIFIMPLWSVSSCTGAAGSTGSSFDSSFGSSFGSGWSSVSLVCCGIVTSADRSLIPLPSPKDSLTVFLLPSITSGDGRISSFTMRRSSFSLSVMSSVFSTSLSRKASTPVIRDKANIFSSSSLFFSLAQPTV